MPRVTKSLVAPEVAMESLGRGRAGRKQAGGRPDLLLLTCGRVLCLIFDGPALVPLVLVCVWVLYMRVCVSCGL